MNLCGEHFVDGGWSAESPEWFNGFQAQNGAPLSPAFHEGSSADVDRTARVAERDFDRYRTLAPEKRADFLEAIAEEFLADGPSIMERAASETALPLQRLEAELGRTVNQLKLFAKLVRQGRIGQLRIDRGDPGRQPLPKPDIRLRMVPLGPVAVFGASNFPLAFSVAGGDTASALASGCPVVFKGHPAHPGTSELSVRALARAMERCAIPAGVFSFIQGSGNEVGAALATHPQIKAIAFTGSLQGGRALFDLACARPEPIPVYAEMGSVNPLFLLPQRLKEKAEELGRAHVDSFTLGVGQFCTSPGLVFGLKGEALERFLGAAAERMAEIPAGSMLSPRIRENFDRGVKRLGETEGINAVGGSFETAQEGTRPALFRTTAAALAANPAIAEEVFGPASVVVECASQQEMIEAARRLEGQLTATLHGTEQELAGAGELLTVLERKAGRLIANGFPTGVEVCHAMSHGGPYPASTDSRTTSVGTLAADRFLRPVCYQNFPEALLPEALRDDNPRGAWRLVDGELSEKES